MSYGFVALLHPPNLLEEVFQSVWYKCLPALKVNRNICKEWRMLPLWFQGLEMPNPNLDLLCNKIHCLRHNWGTASVTGWILRCSYKVFQVEVRLGGNILARSFSNFLNLATMGWFTHLW